MFTTSTLKQALLVVFIAVLFAAACSSDGGRGDQLVLPDTTDAEATTTSDAPSTSVDDTSTSVGEPSTTIVDEPSASVVEPSTSVDAPPTAVVEVHDDESDHVHNDDGTVTAVETTTTAAADDQTDIEVPPVTTVAPPVITVAPTTTTAAPDDQTDIEVPTTTTVVPTTATVVPTTATVVPTTTVSVQLEVSQNVVCGDGLVKLDEFVTETDNGCRKAECPGGRDDQTGECRWYDEWLDTLVRECPTVDTSDGLGVMGSVDKPGTSSRTFPQMVPGSSWVADIWLADNANWDWKPGGVAPTDPNQKPYFIMSLGVGTYVPRVVGGSNGVLWTTNQEEGSQTVEFTVPANKPQEPAFKFGASVRGAGCWAVRFTRTG